MAATLVVVGGLGIDRNRSLAANKAIAAMIMLYVFAFNVSEHFSSLPSESETLSPPSYLHLCPNAPIFNSQRIQLAWGVSQLVLTSLAMTDHC